MYGQVLPLRGPHWEKCSVSPRPSPETALWASETGAQMSEDWLWMLLNLWLLIPQDSTTLLREGNTFSLSSFHCSHFLFLRPFFHQPEHCFLTAILPHGLPTPHLCLLFIAALCWCGAEGPMPCCSSRHAKLSTYQRQLSPKLPGIWGPGFADSLLAESEI